MKIERPQHPAELRRAELFKKASPSQMPPDGMNEYASFSAQLAARTEKLRTGAGTTPRMDAEEFTEPSSAFLSISYRALAIGAGGAALLLLSGALIAWGPSFQAWRSLSSNRIEQAKADVPSAGKLEAKAKPPESAPIAAAPVDPPAPPPPPVRPDIVRSSVDVVPASPQVPPTAQATVQANAQATTAPLTRDETRDLQGKLKAAGFDPGPVDGALGPQTRSAVRKYADARAMPNADNRDLLSRLKTEAPPATATAATPPPADKPTADPAPDPSASSMTSDEIRDLQDRLKAAGFNPGASDGTMGRQTRSAVREYADARSLPNTAATKELLARLKAESPAPITASTTQDNTASLTPDEIRDLQTRLRAAGFNPGASDGTMGRQTRSAVREYADARSLPGADLRDLLSHLKTETP
jgi:peptidoglycan hydrolase-like protein with peptidoglycan-binding domain